MTTTLTNAEQHDDWPSDWVGSATVPIGVDQAFNGYLAAQIIFSLDRLELLGELERGQVDVPRFALRKGADERLLRELLGAAAKCGYVSVRADTVSLTAAGREVARMRGYFTWAVGGYSRMFADMTSMVSGEHRFNRDVFRDEAMVALGSGRNDRALMSGILDDVLAKLDFAIIADLGSGTAARVCRVAGSREGVRGIGLDISEAATQLAQTTIKQAELGGRVQALRADVLDLVSGRQHHPVLAEVDTVMSFFLLHDLLADPAVRPQVLARLREVFPQAGTFLLADTMLAPSDAPAGTLPVFSVGYELAHALMGVPLHTKETYEALFAQAGLSIQRVLPFGTPHSWLYVLEAD